MIRRVYEEVVQHKACVAGMPVKDTIKIVDTSEFAEETPDRSRVWLQQIHQVYQIILIKNAYKILVEKEEYSVTDDAMVVEKILGKKVKLVRGSYENIKITTPEDLLIANVYLQHPE